MSSIGHYANRGLPRPANIPGLGQFTRQCQYLDTIAASEIPRVQVSPEELEEKHRFRLELENICRQVVHSTCPHAGVSLSLQSYGSFASGFATKGADIDLHVSLRGAKYILDSRKQLLHNICAALLTAGFGARLIQRTRVPVIKVCQHPTPGLLTSLKEEANNWYDLSEDGESDVRSVPESPLATSQDVSTGRAGVPFESVNRVPASLMELVSEKRVPNDLKTYAKDFRIRAESLIRSGHLDLTSACSLFLTGIPPSIRPQVKGKIQFDLNDPPSYALEKLEGLVQPAMLATMPTTVDRVEEASLDKPRKSGWTRERKAGPLDFPKEGVGIHADINFGNELALYNSRLLYCYSLCDDRVTPMVLFVKSWAKRRKINNPYSGTLSSYGYVLMVLHFLLNVVQPPALQNLQHFLPKDHTVHLINNKWPVSFFDNTTQLIHLKSQPHWILNTDPLGVLLRNFFHYYARYGPDVIAGGFDWTTHIVSLRTPGGLLHKEDKGWVRAETTLSEELIEVRQRYVLAIEDPFEIEHNVARTVTGPGARAIKDEFRRAWRIVATVGNEKVPVDGGLLDEFVEREEVSDDVVSGVTRALGEPPNGVC